VLDGQEHLGAAAGGAGQADGDVEFVAGAEGLDLRVILGDTLAVKEAGLALVAGDRDIEAGTVGVKDLSNGEQVEVAIDSVVAEVRARLS
jgi:hypothetical protein